MTSLNHSCSEVSVILQVNVFGVQVQQVNAQFSIVQGMKEKTKDRQEMRFVCIYRLWATRVKSISHSKTNAV